MKIRLKISSAQLHVLRRLMKMEDPCGIPKTIVDCEVALIDTAPCTVYSKLTAEATWASVPKVITERPL